MHFRFEAGTHLEEYVALLPTTYSHIPEMFTDALKICRKSTMLVILQFAVTVCTAERLFSCMKQLKNYLRFNTKEDRLSSLALIYPQRSGNKRSNK